jgi:hypothetical protein
VSRLVRTLATVVAAVLLPLTAPTPSTAARPALQVSVTWPEAPVRNRAVTVHVTRAGDRPTLARLQVRQGRSWWTAQEKEVTSRSFVFRLPAHANRYRVRVVLPQLHVASHGFAAPELPPLVHRVDYADGAVHTRVPGRRLGLLFTGRRGQEVEVSTDHDEPDACRSIRLTGPVGPVPVHQGLWRLPSTGDYRVDVVPCWGYAVDDVDVTRVRRLSLRADASPVVLRRRAGVADVGVVDVPRSGRVLVRTWPEDSPARRDASITLPTGRVVEMHGPPLALEPGALLGDRWGTVTVGPGRHLLRSSEDVRVGVSTAVTTTLTPEGEPATLGDAGVAGREREFRFAGTVGSLVYLEPGAGATEPGTGITLVGPDGGMVPEVHSRRGWLLPSDGTYAVRVTPGPGTTAAGAPVTVRLREAVRVPTMAYDTATRFTVQEPGRWLFAPVEVPKPPPYAHRFAASDAAMTGAWQATVGWSLTYHCGPGPGPNGCGDDRYASVDQDGSSAPYLLWADSLQQVVVLRPGPDVTGSVDLALRPGP